MIQDVAGLGRQLKAARTSQRRSLRQVARLVGTSHSTIDRLERGRLAADQTVVAALDELYAAGGRFADAYGRFLHPEWDGAKRNFVEERPKTTRQHGYPEEYTGDVWIAVRPADANVGQPHLMELAWGPFRRTIQMDSLPVAGITFVTGKNGTDHVPLRVTTSPDAHVLFGTDDGQINLSGGVSIHEGWHDEETPDGATLTTQMLLEAIRRAATFPGVPAAERHRLSIAYQALKDLGPDVTRDLGEYIITTLRASRR